MMDFFDDYLFGPLNLIDRLTGLIRGVGYGDLGHKFTVRYADRGGHHSRAEIEAMLSKYGIAVYGRTHDANHMHFLVKKRQAPWADYLMRNAGVAIVGEPLAPGNGSPKGKLPAAWIDQPQRRRAKRKAKAARPRRRTKNVFEPPLPDVRTARSGSLRALRRFCLPLLLALFDLLNLG